MGDSGRVWVCPNRHWWPGPEKMCPCAVEYVPKARLDIAEIVLSVLRRINVALGRSPDAVDGDYPVEMVIALKAEVERLRGALKPFAEAVEHYDPAIDGNLSLDFGRKRGTWLPEVRVKHLRRAAEALAPPASEPLGMTRKELDADSEVSSER